MSADLWTVKAALEVLPATCRHHGDDFGKLGYEGPHGQPRCESCVAPWRRMCGMAAVQRLRDGSPESRPMTEWRVGRKLGRTLYRDDQLVGLVDTAEIAAEIIEALNGRLRALAPAACGCPVTLSSARRTSHTRECSDRQSAERIAAGVAGEIECPCCHGNGTMVCRKACHRSPCDVCSETGRVDPKTNKDAQRILREGAS